MLRQLASILMTAVIAILINVPAAFAIGPYQSTAAGGFGNTANPCTGTPFVRTIFVADSFTISDLDVGLLIDHTWRLDTRATLQSPAL